MSLRTAALLALAATGYSAPANNDLPTDAAGLEDFMNNPSVQSSLSAAMNSLNSYLDANPGAMSSLSGALNSLSAGHLDLSSDAAHAKPMAAAAAAVGVSLVAALF